MDAKDLKEKLIEVNRLIYQVQVGNIAQSKAFEEIHRIIEEND